MHESADSFTLYGLTIPRTFGDKTIFSSFVGSLIVIASWGGQWTENASFFRIIALGIVIRRFASLCECVECQADGIHSTAKWQDSG